MADPGWIPRGSRDLSKESRQAALSLQIQASCANASATPRINPILAGTPLAAAGALMVVRRRKGDLVANAFEHKGPGHVCFAKN